jgi:hypothetical protein
MNLDFAAALADLNRQAPGGDAAFALANGARTPADYLFQTLLPNISMMGYSVASTNMTVRSTMAGLVGMDSPYPPGGIVQVSKFLEQTAKIAIHTKLNEQTLRLLQELVVRMFMAGQPTNEVAANEALNFLEKVIIQPLLDTEEWLRSEVINFGAINWAYGVPGANFLTTRTGGDHYGGATSKFWTDMYLLQQRLKGRVRMMVAHPDTMQLALYNEANGLVQVGGDGRTSIQVRRWARNTAGASTPGVFSPDARDTVTVMLYDREAEILDINNPGGTIVVPFQPRGRIVAIGDVQNTGYVPGQGSQDENLDPRRLGYTHIAPTVEGGGRIGRWSQLYVPENAPWELHGRGAENLLPVLERPDAIAVASTDMS